MDGPIPVQMIAIYVQESKLVALRWLSGRRELRNPRTSWNDWHSARSAAGTLCAPARSDVARSL